MKKPFLFFILSFQLQIAICQTAYFQQQVNYKIDVTLNDVENTFDGFEIIEYTNNSPDTLRFIWFHLWPNAYKSDRTAFSEQLLQIGRTDFYFSNDDKRGYINRLDFKVNGVTSVLEDHPLYIDVAKLILPTPLAPHQTIKITTPFHEKIPFNFSRGGHVGNTYQATQWYPKPAVYDRQGWHPMPYLDQGEFYSEFGNFTVQITLPKDYVVAATGELQNEDEVKWLKSREQESVMRDQGSVMSDKGLVMRDQGSVTSDQRAANSKQIAGSKKLSANKGKAKVLRPVTSAPSLRNTKFKTLTYIQNNVHDFAWFADKNYSVLYDTLTLLSGRVINVWSFFTPGGKEVWKNSIAFIKDAVKTRSEWLGEYPYNNVSAVEAKMGFAGGMEYPTITSISPMQSERSLDLTIEHEVGHNWNYGILASNERAHPWMDEGMNTYFDNRYEKIKYPEKYQLPLSDKFIQNRSPKNVNDFIFRTLVGEKKDQPIGTSSERFSTINYIEVAYYKTGEWMKALEDFIGQPLFDSCLHEYYNRWKFKHPYPEDFKKVVEDVSHKNVDTIFLLLSEKGEMKTPVKKNFKLKSFISFRDTDKHNYIFVAPAVGINVYDNLMVGGLIHNYTLPEPNFHFIIAPMYATGSNSFTAIGKVGYNIMSYGFIRKTEISISGEKFTADDFVDSNGKKNYLPFSKIVPSVKLIFRNKNAQSTITKSIQWKTYFIKETNLLFSRDTIKHVDVISYPKNSRYLNQLKLNVENNRVLYPYTASLQGEQGKDFIRLAFDGSYFFNYAKGGGLSLRLFGGKFIYLGDKTILKQFETDRYHLNMSGPNGYEDYTYSNYFFGRNEFKNFSSQQMMIRDGGFKVRTDLLANKIGKTDDWLAAANFKTDFPEKLNPLQVLPFKIPLK
ncbi:MAG: M1 family metallopeptidase, partial [Bacteroidota bacterium]|nr:M1 family metallopeptidase [Bacteroidota bacterium]